MLMNFASRKFSKFEVRKNLTEFMQSVQQKYKLSENDGPKLQLAYLRELQSTGDHYQDKNTAPYISGLPFELLKKDP